MANVSRPVSLSKKMSSVSDVSSKHIYDDVFSAPPATKLHASAFLSRIDDYREIFPPSSASLGSSIPILDLPAETMAPSSSVDYAGVFGGSRDDGIGVLSEQLFGDSRKKAQHEAQLPRSRTQTGRVPSKSQEFSCNHGNDPTSPPAQTRMQYSKSQEFPRNFGNNQMSMSPLQKGTPFLKSEEFSGNSPKDQTSASELSHQTVDSVKRINVSYHKTTQPGKDGINGMTHIAHLHAVPGYTHVFDEVGPVRKPRFDKAKSVSMVDADFSVDVGEVPRNGKHTRAASDLGTNKHEANCKPQTCSMSVSNSPQSFGGSDYFKRSASQRSKCSRRKQGKSGIRYCSQPLLDEELDVDSVAAVSAAAVKRAIEEAEEKIRWAKEFLKGLEDNGFIKPSLKDSFKIKVAISTKHSSESYGPKENGSLKVKARRQKNIINEEKVLRSNGCLNIKASGENDHANEAGGVQAKDDLGIKATRESQHESEADGLKVTNMEKSVRFRSPCAPETFEETPEQLELENNAEQVGKTNAHQELKLAEQICKNEGRGEWEAAKHLSQLISGVRNKLVSFISKQADTEKTVMQKEAPTKLESLEQSEERACKVQNVDTDKQRGADLENLEKQAEMNHCTGPMVQEPAEDSNRASVDMEICEAEEKKVKRSAAPTSPDIEVHTNKQCCPHEPEEELEKVETKESANDANNLKQEDVTTEVKGEGLQEVQEQSQEILDGTVRMAYEKSQMGTTGPEERANILEAANQSSGYEKGTNWEDDEEVVEEVRELEPVDNEVDGSFSSEAVNCRQLEGCVWEETKMAKDAQKKQEDVRIVEETCMVEEQYERVVGNSDKYSGEGTQKIAGQDVMSRATEGLTGVADEDSEIDEYLAAAVDINDQDELLFSSENEASVCDKRNQYAQDMERLAESATVPFEPEENVDLSRSLERANELITEGICEQTLCSIEVVDEGPEHDEYLPAVDDIPMQDEQSYSSRNEETSAHDDLNQCALDVDLPFQKERVAERTFTTSEPEGNIEKPSSIQTANELVGDNSSNRNKCPIEAAYESLKHGHYLSAADDAFLNRSAGAYRHDNTNENAQAQDVKFSFKDEKRMATDGSTSECEGNVEQPSFVQTVNELIGEQMVEVFISAGDRLHFDKTEEIEDAHGAQPSANIQMTECEAVLNFEQKHSDEEPKDFATDIGSENQDDESEVSTSTREANKATEQDGSPLNGESSHKRKRWFENRVEAGQFQPAGILEMDQENTEDSKIEDGVEIHVDEIISESGEGVCMGKADVGSDNQEGGHGTEVSHRRRRWFENRGEKVLHKPSPFNKIGLESKHDDSSQGHVDRLADERKESNVANDQVASRVSSEAAHRRRRWFENGEKLGAAQQPDILEDNDTTAELKKENGTGLGMADTHQSEGQSNQREKEKERLAVERAIREARQRAFAEARERAAAEARLKAAAGAQDRQGKTSSEGKSGSDKASMDAKLRAERAAVERATAEARERALQKAMSEKATYNPKNSGSSCSAGYSTSVPSTESPQRRKAISERNKRTMERAAKALEEKNMRDFLAQKEQAERNRYANVLDAEVKRWLSGKEGNLRSLLSTLQYILGPDSGWQPIPLTDLVSTTAVRKAYKRAALCVHPDKLQQRRATIQQKYICEKVFDLLKDAWHKFNPDDR